MLPIDKVVILAGGKGTRIIEESQYKPKPLVEIGGIPIILHIMSIFSYYGVNNFYILVGHKSLEIKKYFLNDLYGNSHLFLDYQTKSIKFKDTIKKEWRVNIIETGENTQTGGRLLKAKSYLGDDPFFLTYGDCLSDINLSDLYKSHVKNKKIATVTGIQQKNRFGSLNVNKSGTVKSFTEKPLLNNALISGGFFIFNKEIFKYLKGPSTVLEKDPLSFIANKKQLNCFFHNKFWFPMDNLREKKYLEQLWQTGKAPWKKFTKKLI